jgi:hypothetical protein
MEPIASRLSKQDRLRIGADDWSWPIAMGWWVGGAVAIGVAQVLNVEWRKAYFHATFKLSGCQPQTLVLKGWKHES